MRRSRHGLQGDSSAPRHCCARQWWPRANNTRSRALSQEEEETRQPRTKLLTVSYRTSCAFISTTTHHAPRERTCLPRKLDCLPLRRLLERSSRFERVFFFFFSSDLSDFRGETSCGFSGSIFLGAGLRRIFNAIQVDTSAIIRYTSWCEIFVVDYRRFRNVRSLRGESIGGMCECGTP